HWNSHCQWNRRPHRRRSARRQPRHSFAQCRPNARAFCPPKNKTLCRHHHMTPITEELVFDALRQVIDPELGCNIVDLGLIYSINICGGNVTVTMTLTTPGCPMHESISQGAQTALLSLAGVTDAEVTVVWDPPWHPSMMTEQGRIATHVGN